MRLTPAHLGFVSGWLCLDFEMACSPVSRDQATVCCSGSLTSGVQRSKIAPARPYERVYARVDLRRSVPTT